LQVVAADLELVTLPPEVAGLVAVAESVEVIKDNLGLAVNGLSAGAALLGESCDVAVASVEDGRGAGNAVVGW
jgi:hypothetical protein